LKSASGTESAVGGYINMGGKTTASNAAIENKYIGLIQGYLLL
jgi:hypothetical protein